MNVTLDTQLSPVSVTGTDKTTAYQTTADSLQVGSSGYSLDITENKVTDDSAYQGHGLTAQDIMSKAENTNVQAQKDFMIVMSNSVSGEDLEKLEEEGFNPGSTDVETYVSIADRIKVTLAQAGVEIAGYNDDLDAEIVEEITGSRIDANELTKKLQQADIPVTQDNVEALAETIAEGSQIRGLSEDAIKYLLMNRQAPTIDNLYVAQFSSAASLKQAQGYYSAYGQGYYAKKADTIQWESIQSGIDAVISQSGLENTEDTQEAARWLVQSGIELTPENLTALSELRDLKLPMDTEQLMDTAITAMSNGKQPNKALLTGEQPVWQQAAELAGQVEEISDDAIHLTVESKEVLNLKNLYAAQKAIDAGEMLSVSTDAGEPSLKEIEARRQLEEIRLVMTQEANRQLLKSGYQIDTAQLQDLVEALKLTEANLKAAMFQGGTDQVNEESALLYEDTLTVTTQLSSMPAALLGKVAAAKTPFTLGKLHQEGSILQSRYQKAGETYEALMTAPRKDMGDSIQKAFCNVDDILEDMELEVNDSNRRAVRILGYNSMELSEENIEAVKEADAQVSSVIRRMTPAATLQMIREQVNPLEMNLDELEEYLNEQAKDSGADADKYAKYLQKLDRSNAITDEEREAYIGIYRLFRQIEKSDGAVIGSVVASGAEMNFKNMLSAIRTNKRKDMDITVDDGFGGLEKLITHGSAIDEQIMTGFGNTQEQTQQHREHYYAVLSGEIEDELSTRTAIRTLQEMDIGASTTIEQFAEGLKEADAERTQQDMSAFRESMQKAAQTEEAVIQALIDYEQPVSVNNIQAAELLLMERGSLYKRIFGNAKEDALRETAERAIEQLNDKDSAVSAYQELIDEASAAVENMIYSSDSVIDVRAAQMLYKGLSLAGNLSRDENYELPVEIRGELTSINLRIYHNSSQTGKVTVTMDSEILGRVAADFDVGSGRISGMIAYDSRPAGADMEALREKLTAEFAQAQQENGEAKTISVSLVETKDLDLNRFGQDRDIEESERLSTKELYQTAKAFITALKSLNQQQKAA